MKASHRVRFSNGHTSGFIVDERYMGYNSVLSHIDFISNLKANKHGEIRALGKSLPETSVLDLNETMYREICKSNQIVRDIQADFSRWKEKWSNYILYLSGARQTGKTTELLRFAYKSYEQIIYVNLSERFISDNFVDLVVHSSSKQAGLSRFCISMLGEREYMDRSDTILILDEIQESSEVYNSLRALQAGLSCHIAVTGSYLGRVLSKEFFKPAGNTYDMELLTLSFREFCRVFSAEKTLDDISVSGKSQDFEYRKLADLYRLYTQIGGYPDVVSTYIKTGDISDCMQVLSNIADRFTDESACYFEGDRSRILFNCIYKAAVILQAKDKKGTGSKLTDLAVKFITDDIKGIVSRKEVNAAVSWLIYNGLLGTCDLYNQGEVIELLYDSRIYFRDCGILNFILSITAVNDEKKKGLIAETFAYNELYRVYKRTPKAVKGDKPCYDIFESEFMTVDVNDRKYGTKIKSNKASDHKSLQKYLDKALVDAGIIAEITIGGINEKRLRIPIYTIGEKFPYQE